MEKSKNAGLLFIIVLELILAGCKPAVNKVLPEESTISLNNPGRGFHTGDE